MVSDATRGAARVYAKAALIGAMAADKLMMDGGPVMAMPAAQARADALRACEDIVAAMLHGLDADDRGFMRTIAAEAFQERLEFFESAIEGEVVQ